MKKIVFLFALVSLTSLIAQETEVKTGPVIENFGKVYQVENPDLLLKSATEYKVIFDIYTDNSKDNSINPLLNTVARYLNMHAQQGILLENMKVVVILHGAATKSALSDEGFQELYKIDNPNNKLIEDLKNATVELFVCGQSYLANGFNLKDKSQNVKLALSALTALVEYQRNGYQIINFN